MTAPPSLTLDRIVRSAQFRFRYLKWRLAGIFIFAMRRRWRRVRVTKDTPGLLVISPGGVASSMLLEALATFVPTNDVEDRDGLKHLPAPPVLTDPSLALRAIYIYGDEQLALRSLARRGFLTLQCAKLGSVGGALLRGNAQERCFTQAMRAQRARWRACQAFPVLMLDFDQIWSEADRIAAFAGVGVDQFRVALPPRKVRSSEVTTQ